MARTLPLVVVLASFPGFAHDVAADVGASFSAPAPAKVTGADGGVSLKTQNPRTGSVSASASGSYDFNDSWSAWLGLNYTRDLPTKTDGGTTEDPSTSSPGSNIFLISAGAMWIASEHFSLMAGGNLSPKTTQRNALDLSLPPEAQLLGLPSSVSAVLRSENSSWGANVAAMYGTNGDSKFESNVDASVGLTDFGVFQQFELSSRTSTVLTTLCRRKPEDVCKLLGGAKENLLQVRLSAGYTATLFQDLDVGLDGSFYLYSKDPNEVGYYPTVALGRDIGSGVPVAPLLFTARPSVSYRFSKVTLRLSYQLGVYTGGLGSSNLVSLKTSVKVTKSFRLSLLVSVQGDRDANGPVSTGGTAVLGALVLF